MTLGEKIQILRKQRGLSQEQLAEKITISRQAISRWELNESIPDVENILQLSKVFNVSTDFLLTGAALDIPAEGDEDEGEKVYDRPMPTYEKRKSNSMRTLRKLFIMIGIASPGLYLVLGFWFQWWHPGWLVILLPWMFYAGCAAAEEE